jgi:hypothetical protein
VDPRDFDAASNALRNFLAETNGRWAAGTSLSPFL